MEYEAACRVLTGYLTSKAYWGTISQLYGDGCGGGGTEYEAACRVGEGLVVERAEAYPLVFYIYGNSFNVKL